jgi:hypothetical protein
MGDSVVAQIGHDGIEQGNIFKNLNKKVFVRI